MWGKKEDGLTKDEIFNLKSVFKVVEGFREEIKSFRTLIDSIDRRTNPAAMVDPERAKKDVVEAVITKIFADSGGIAGLIEEARKRAVEKIIEDVDIDTGRIEELLSESDKFINEVIAKLDKDNIKDSVVDAVAEKIIDEHLNTDDISEKVSEAISERLNVTLKPEDD